MGETVKVFRAAVVAVIVLDVALLSVSVPLRATSLRYETARKQQELRMLALEHRELLLQVAEARRPGRLAEKAVSFGIDLRAVEQDAIVRSDGAATAGGRPVVVAPRR